MRTAAAAENKDSSKEGNKEEKERQPLVRYWYRVPLHGVEHRRELKSTVTVQKQNKNNDNY